MKIIRMKRKKKRMIKNNWMIMNLEKAKKRKMNSKKRIKMILLKK